MKTILATALLLLSSLLFSQTTVTIVCNNSGSVNSAGFVQGGNMLDLGNNLNGTRGFVSFDLSAIPVGVNIVNASIRYITFSSVASDLNNNLHGFAGNTGTPLYDACASGNSFNNSSWLADGVNTKSFNPVGLSFIAENAGYPVNIGFVRSGPNPYNIYGYLNASNLKPELTVTYAFIPCTGTLAGGVTLSNLKNICDTTTPFTLTVSGALAGNTSGLSYQWQSSADTITWHNITGATNQTLITSQSLSTWYRRRTACGTNYGYSTAERVFTNEMANGGTILGIRYFCGTSQPVKLYISGIQSSTNLSYQWQQSADGILYTDISGAIQDTLNTTIASETYFLRKTFCGSNAFYSNTRRIQVGSSPVVPVYKDFTGEGNGCFTQDNNNRWTVSPANAFINGRTNGWPVYQRIWLYSPGILLTAQKTYRVRYYRYMKGTDTEACSIFLYAGRAPQADSMKHWMLAEWSDANWPPSGSLIGYTYADFTPTTTGTYYFGWGYSADGPTTVTINNLSVKLSPSCPTPVNLTISNLTPTSATFNWQTNNDNGNDTVLNYKWRIDRTAAPFSDSGFVTGNQITLSNLTPDTGYTFKILSNCGEHSIPPYSNTTTISFRTAGQNDDCSGATDILQTAYSDSCSGQSVSTFYGSASGNPPLCNSADFEDDVWYRFVATNSKATLKFKNYAASTGVSTGPVFAIYEDSCNANSTVACNFVPLPLGYGETDIIGLTVGKTYYLRLASKGMGAVVNFNFCVMVPDSKIPLVTGVSNDFFCAGLPIFISGVNFNGAISVKLGALPADSFSIVSNNSIKAYFNKAYQGYINVLTPFGHAIGALVTIKSNPVLAINAPCCLGGNESIIVNTDAGIRWLSLYLDYRGEMDYKSYSWQTNGIVIAGGNGTGNQPNQLNVPFSVAKDVNGNFYVADAGNNRVQKFVPGNNNGITVAGGNGAGAGANQLTNPRGVFVDATGNIYVADAGNNRIQKWLPNSTTGITVAGGNGSGISANQFNFPHSVVVDDSGYIYVADANNNRIQKFAPNNVTGITVAGGNGSGSAANQLNYATGVFVDAASNVYVNDFTNNRIQKWPVGAVTGITVAGGNGAGSASNQLDAPRGLFVDYYGNVYVADQNNHRIQKWAPGSSIGETVAGGNGSGSDSNQLASPASVFGDNVDRGYFYVADRLNNRIQKFGFPTTYSYKPGLPGLYQPRIIYSNSCANEGEVRINPVYSTTICPDSRIFFLSGNPITGNTYQWQVNTGSGFVNIGNSTIYSGTNSDSMWLNKPPTTWYGNIYRCVINGSQFSTEYQLKFAVKWTGYFGDDWEGTYNWDCGILPDENTDVIIKADQYQFPVIGSNAVCRSLILDPGAKLTIKSWGNLQVKKQN